MSELAIELLKTDDAHVWAKEFCRINPCADFDVMVGWFANAITASEFQTKKRLGKITEAADQFRDATEMVSDSEKADSCKICNKSMISGHVYQGLFLCSNECLDKQKEMDSPKKLKPVDENCLYKPVNCIHPEEIKVVIYEGKANFFGVEGIMFDYKEYKDVMGLPESLSRIEDYDYGDGGNYE